MGGVSKGKINLVELSNVRVNGQSSYRMLTVVLHTFLCLISWDEMELCICNRIYSRIRGCETYYICPFPTYS